MPAVVTAPIGRCEAVARDACRILDADAVIVTAFGPGRLVDRMLAQVGSAAVSEAELDLLDGQEQDAAADGTGSHLRVCRLPDGPTSDVAWWSATVGVTAAPPVGALHFRTTADWNPDPRRRSMTRVFATHLTHVLVGAPSRAFTDEQLLLLAREMSELGLTAESYDELLGGTAAAVAPLLDARTVGIGMWYADGQYLQLLPGSFGSDRRLAATSQVPGSDHRGMAGRVRITGRAHFSNDLDQDSPDYAAWLHHLGVRNLLTLPLRSSGRFVGVLHIANKDSAFGTPDVARATELLPLVASATEHVRHRLETKHKEQMATVLSRAGTAMAKERPLKHLKASVLPDFCTTIDAVRLAVSFEDGSPPLVVRDGPLDAEVEHRFLEESASGAPALRTTTRRPREALDMGSAAVHVPVVTGGLQEATFSILRVPRQAFSKADIAAVRQLAKIIALALATRRVHEQRLDSARERERQRIADDLHDHVAQILFSGQLTLQAILEQQKDDAPFRDGILRACDLLVRGQTSIREVINQLSASIDGDLAQALSTMAATVGNEFGSSIEVVVERSFTRLSASVTPSISDVVLSGVREAVVNASKHAPGCRIRVNVRVVRQRLLVSIDDDGPGIPKDARREGYGLRATRRRLAECDGHLRIGASASGGTRSLISMPLPGRDSRAQ